MAAWQRRVSVGMEMLELLLWFVPPIAVILVLIVAEKKDWL